VWHCKYSSILYHFRVILSWKCRNLEIWVRGHSRSLKLVLFESFGTVSYSHSIVTMSPSCITSEIKILLANSDYFHFSLHSTPPLGVSPSEYCHTVGTVKLERRSYPTLKKSLMIRLAGLTEYRHVTDRQTDRRTDGQTSCDLRDEGQSQRSRSHGQGPKIWPRGQGLALRTTSLPQTCCTGTCTCTWTLGIVRVLAPWGLLLDRSLISISAIRWNLEIQAYIIIILEDVMYLRCNEAS